MQKLNDKFKFIFFRKGLTWCGLLKDINNKSKIKLDDVKGSCERFMTYCSKIESFCHIPSLLEITLSIIIFTWSILRCNPIHVLLKLIIGSKTIRQQQKSLQLDMPNNIDCGTQRKVWLKSFAGCM